MKIKIQGLRSGGVAIAELSGAQLEVFDEILRKIALVNEVHVKGRNYYLDTQDPHDIKLELDSSSTGFIAQSTYDSLQAEERIGAMKATVASILGFNRTIPSEAQKQDEWANKLQDELYYTYNQIDYHEYKNKSYAWERGSLEHECIDFMADGLPTIRCNKDGSIEKFPV